MHGPTSQLEMVMNVLKGTLHLLVSATALASLPARAETITVAGYSGVFADGYKTAVIEPFEKANPGITVKYFPMFNSSQLLGTLYAERSDPTIDVVVMDLAASKGASDQGIFEPLTPQLVPAMNDLVSRAKVSGVAGVPVTFDSVALVYNTKLVTPAPSSWLAMKDAKYKGQVAVSAPPGLLGIAFTRILDSMAGGTNPLTGMSKGIDLAGDIAPNVKSFEPKDWYPLVASGEVAMAVGWNARGQIYADQTKGAVGVVIPKEGTTYQVNTINLVNKSKHRDASLKFTNFALAPDSQAAVAHLLHYLPTNKNVQLNAEDSTRTGAGSKVLDTNWIAMAPLNARITQDWRRKVVGKGD
jgi:putative spermidine/putrescine transport system substrate-binding protein